MSCIAICSSICDANRYRVHQLTNGIDAMMAQTRPAGPAQVAALSAAGGCFRAPAGKAACFTLAFQSDSPARENPPTSKEEM
jgi:hypothetical protein